jgi:3-deoxy-7-phosphoheptulonate synthase
MMIIMRSDASSEQVSSVVQRVESLGLQGHLSQGVERTVIGIVGDRRHVTDAQFVHLPGVDRVVPISRPYKLTSREFKPDNSVFPLDGVGVGGDEVVIIAGPCSVESRSQLLEIAHAVREAGAHALRGGAFKPRTSPYSFQGLGEAGLVMLAEAREETGMPVVTEIMSPDQIGLLTRYADVLQIGARNMQNYSLLHAVGESQHPVLLKRGLMATVEELLMAAEYVLSHGNRRVMLCERGIRTFETSTRSLTCPYYWIPVTAQAIGNMFMQSLGLGLQQERMAWSSKCIKIQQRLFQMESSPSNRNVLHKWCEKFVQSLKQLGARLLLCLSLM